ncbi:OprO/OprP family phosphate-selective porin [Luteimonas sp. A277]
MRSSRTFCASVALAACVAAAPQARAIDWGTAGPFEIAFEGMLQVDGYRYRGDWNHLGDDTDFRRAELVLKGQGPGGFDWVVGYDAHGDNWLDVNGRLRFAEDSQYLRVGQFKQPVGLEELSSASTNDFISKAAATNVFAVSRRLGAGWGLDRGNWSVAGSWFDREMSRGGTAGQGVAARGTWAPLLGDGEALHLGLSAARFDAPDSGSRLRARPQADLADQRLIDTGLMGDAQRQLTIGAEAAWFRGPVKLQAEWFESRVERRLEPDFDASGGYVSALWNVTGERWTYRDGVIRTPTDGDGQAGLWQLGLRWDRVDLDDYRVLSGSTGVEGIAGGSMDALTVGVNWYWSERLKVAFNYVLADTSRRDAATGSILDVEPEIASARVQLHW